MKKIQIILMSAILLLSANSVNAQSNTIVNDNAAWATLIYISGFAPPTSPLPPWVKTEYYFFDGDSLFNGKIYKQLFYCTDEQHTEHLFAGLMREENKKTYFIPYHIGLETLLEESVLYDFSLEQGETFEYIMGGDYSETLYVLQNDSVLINNEQKKRLVIAPQNNLEWVIDTIIENVGSLHGLLYPSFYMRTGAFHELLCYYENNELLYHSSVYKECFYDDPAEIWAAIQNVEVKNLKIYPNPAIDILTVEISNEKISQVDIFDVSGRKIYDRQFNNNNKSKIAVNNISNGLYFIKIQTEYGKTYLSKFFIKK